MSDPPNIDLSDDSPGDRPNRQTLVGQTIVVTRAAEQADSLCRLFEQLGAKTIAHPVIHILPSEDFSDLDRIISRIDEFEWLVFVSTNAVRFFLERFAAIHGSFEKLMEKKVASIGQATLQQLKQLAGLDVDLVPPDANSQSLGAALRASVVGKKILIPRADRRTTTLIDILSEAEIEFEEPITYRSSDVESVDPDVAIRMNEGTIDWVTVTSGAIARSAIRIFGEDLCKAKLVSISSGTSAALRELGFEPDAEAATSNMDGMVKAIEQYVLRQE
jgi:uroporphyrinogen III methyltransferase/synthase